MWPKWSRTLAHLSKLTYIKINFKWTYVKQDAFDKIKRIVARDILSTYLYFNETSKFRTDASVFQLVAVISHKGILIAFYSIKLTGAQMRYIVTEREILSTVETLKEFRMILLGHKLRIYTDYAKPYV